MGEDATLKLTDPELLRSECWLASGWAGAEQSFAVTDPATGLEIARVPRMGAAQTERAIADADAAFPAWAAKTAKERAQILRRWFDLMTENADDLAVLMTAEQGKPLAEAKGEALYAASFVEWFSEEAKRVYGETIPSPIAGNRLMVLRQPIGVTAAITPWNFPAAMITRKAAPALAAGCVMIVKPAEQTPLTALALARLAEMAGIPAGVFQVITGDAREIGGVLTKSDLVRKLSFTGSTEVGRILMEQSAPTIKKLSLELGGNAPFIVFDDADLDAAVEGAVIAKYRNAGQTCVCANRIYVQSGVYDAFAEKLSARVAQLKVGAGTQAGVTIGPLIDDDALAKVETHVEDALAQGAKVKLGGKRSHEGATFYEPTILTGVTQSMRVAREETFGPVAPLFRFETEDEVVAMANDTEFGLAAYFYTTDAARVWRVSESLEYGMVGHNTGLISNEVAPFGGIKQSGLGREGSHHGIEEYLELKYLCSAVG
ncbi:NAD-dependent succinate-semialdehyde dehydrogenase [Mesobaculum littorinae]|uniref:NAD-dependent succinate-semialdehyde dehydrogenase n=1 Tax=Mesobaculum littorinae TaxID=2486419 RepID=A0A438AG80_9RHOB|nr:NAD-dependent succinate-semialdehyde dehydrogenase [Mesobaculum littorinae]RVV97720.1 NAD-dependent succinate-semialdehyde dehydrogenase [Mesobaculum littorinae]